MYLKHFGIKGQKWGVRRYQNPDGTLTPEGRKRYRKIVETSGPYGKNGDNYWDAFYKLKKDRDVRKSELMDKNGKLTKQGMKEYGVKRDKNGRLYLTEYGRKIQADDHVPIGDTATVNLWKSQKFSSDPDKAYKQVNDYYDKLFQDGKIFTEELETAGALSLEISVVNDYNRTHPESKRFLDENTFTDDTLWYLYDEWYNS